MKLAGSSRASVYAAMQGRVPCFYRYYVATANIHSGQTERLTALTVPNHTRRTLANNGGLHMLIVPFAHGGPNTERSFHKDPYVDKGIRIRIRVRRPGGGCVCTLSFLLMDHAVGTAQGTSRIRQERVYPYVMNVWLSLNQRRGGLGAMDVPQLSRIQGPHGLVFPKCGSCRSTRLPESATLHLCGLRKCIHQAAPYMLKLCKTCPTTSMCRLSRLQANAFAETSSEQHATPGSLQVAQ